MYIKYFKRLIDIIASSIALFFLFPFFLLISILILFDLGKPVFFKQERPGKDEKIFIMYKFRTMSNKRGDEGQVLPDKMRVTKLGKFLRKASLDELPELWNVLKGDMSLIGPRPLSVGYLPYYTDYERKRHSVRPGITGYAQINGRAALKWEDRFQYDIDYANNLTFLMDVKIFLKTIIKVIKREDTQQRDEINLLSFHEYRKQSQTFSEIGSDFWYTECNNGDNYLSRFNNAQFVFSGRTAIDYIIKDLDNTVENVLIPSYICASVIEPFKANNLNIIHYDIINEEETFRADLTSLDKTLDKCAMLICDYYCYSDEYYKKLRDYAKGKGHIIIHDITHSLLSEGLDITEDDYYYASLRKWLPIMDGGILGKKEERIEINGNDNNDDYYTIKNQAMNLKREYIQSRKGDKSKYIKLYKDAEEIINNDYVNKAISSQSKKQIELTCYKEIIDIRLKNFNYITAHLNNTDLFKILTRENTCHIFLPMLFKTKKLRDDYREYMKENNVYLPIHWPIPEAVDLNNMTKEIYDRIISLIIDQRYSSSDMMRIIELTNRFIAENNND